MIESRRHGNHGVSNEQFVFPVQDQRAREVPAGFNGRHPREDLLGCSSDELASWSRWVVGARQPLFVVYSDVDWAVERACPDQMRGVVVWVGNLARFRENSIADSAHRHFCIPSSSKIGNA